MPDSVDTLVVGGGELDLQLDEDFAHDVVLQEDAVEFATTKSQSQYKVSCYISAGV